MGFGHDLVKILLAATCGTSYFESHAPYHWYDQEGIPTDDDWILAITVNRKLFYLAFFTFFQLYNLQLVIELEHYLLETKVLISLYHSLWCKINRWESVCQKEHRARLLFFFFLISLHLFKNLFLSSLLSGLLILSY